MHSGVSSQRVGQGLQVLFAIWVLSGLVQIVSAVTNENEFGTVGRMTMVFSIVFGLALHSGLAIWTFLARRWWEKGEKFARGNVLAIAIVATAFGAFGLLGTAMAMLVVSAFVGLFGGANFGWETYVSLALSAAELVLGILLLIWRSRATVVASTPVPAPVPTWR